MAGRSARFTQLRRGLGQMIWLLRHGDAENGAGKPDAERELTAKGERQSRDAGRALAAIGVELDTCLASPKLRARGTAELACTALGVEVEVEERLRGGGFDPLELTAGRGEVILVGHEPDLSAAVAALTGAQVRMRKGGLAAVDGHTLQALYRPKDLARIAASA
jgi:phosphohistidine phosphatase